MALLVTSASGLNGDGYGALLAFDCDGKPLGMFSDDRRISDPRGLAVDANADLLFLNSGSDRVLALDRDGRVMRDTGPIRDLNPGGGVFGPDGRYYVGLRSARTIMALSPSLKEAGERILPAGVVPFPRGFAFTGNGSLFLASGVGPAGEGDDVVVALTQARDLKPWRVILDPELSPLDLVVAPNGNIVVSSEYPFGVQGATSSVREYDILDGRLVRVFSANGAGEFRRPRGLRFGPDGTLYCAARDEVMAFDFASGCCLGAVVRWPRLNGQAVALFP